VEEKRRKGRGGNLNNFWGRRKVILHYLKKKETKGGGGTQLCFLSDPREGERHCSYFPWECFQKGGKEGRGGGENEKADLDF